MSFFYEETKVLISYTSNGLVTWWNLKGEIIKEVKIEEPFFSLWDWSSQDSIIKSYSFDIMRDWNLNGELVRDYGENHQYRRNYNLKNSKYELIEKHYYGNSNYYRNTKLVDATIPMKDSNEYQLVLINKEKEYRTYIYLDGKTKQLVTEYNAKKLERKQKETNRQEEQNKLIRSFAINNFGIYNWDRFYKDENELLVRCEASFNFNVRDEFTDIPVFLITGENKNVVIYFYDGAFDKFYFNPTLYNKLIAILPDNKIAVFEDSDFKTLDTNKIRQEKKHQFQMKILGGVEAMEELGWEF